MIHSTILFLILALCGLAVADSTGTGHSEAPKYNFSNGRSPTDVFTTKSGLNATVYNDYRPYKDWVEKGSGKFFPMDIAPVLTGQASGGVTLPEPKGINASLYQDQAAEFANVVNFRNQGGRPTLQPKADAPTPTLASEQASTYVIQTVMSAVLDRPFAKLNLSADRLSAMAEATDVDHSHFHIPGSFALEALEKNHSAGLIIRPDKDYLLSVIDFRDYGCDTMKSLMATYFSKLPEKQRLINDSIYLISQIEMNTPADVSGIEKFFGKRPDAVLSQTTLYSDHLVRGGRTLFAFFAEGDKTRIVLLSNIGLASKFMSGAKGLVIRQYVLDGFGGGVTGAVTSASDAVNDLLSGADGDVSKKNSCNRGLALGLIKYSESLFNEFAKYMTQ